MSNKCQALNCPMSIPNNKILCRLHIALVPEKLKAELRDAYKRIGGDDLEKWAKMCTQLSSVERLERLRAHDALVKKCIEASWKHPSGRITV